MNRLFIVLDSVRYDNFVKADTPNIDSIGPTKKVYSTSCWTLPSIFNILMLGTHICSGPLLPNYPPSWIPTKFKQSGYHSVFLNANPWITAQKDVFSRGFNKFVDFDLDLSIGHYVLEDMIDACLKYAKEPRYFTFMLVMETHYHAPQGFVGGSQVKAIEYVDKALHRLFKQLKNVRVIVTSDHGDTKEGHNPIKLKGLDMKLFEVPVVIGDL